MKSSIKKSVTTKVIILIFFILPILMVNSYLNYLSNQEIEENIKEQIRGFVVHESTDKESISYYIPQYTLAIIFFIISVSIVVLFLFRYKMPIKHNLFFLSMLNVSLIIMNSNTSSSIMYYIDTNNFRINSFITIIMIVTYATNVTSLFVSSMLSVINLFLKKSRKS